MSVFFVYGLYDLQDVRYVGAASRLGRPLAHEREARKSPKATHKLNWLRVLAREGRSPVWRILEACDSWEETFRAERRIIQELRAAGARLTNGTDGGEGMTNPTSDTRAKMSASAKASHARVETRARMSVAAKLTWARPEIRARMMAAFTRPDVKARMCASAKASHARVETRARMSVAAKLAWARPEVKARKSVASKEAYASPEARAEMSARAKAAWARPEERARKTASVKTAWARPGARERQSAAIKAAWARRKGTSE
jgi:hypothetical protein